MGHQVSATRIPQLLKRLGYRRHVILNFQTNIRRN
jgi:hypothetical protein